MPKAKSGTKPKSDLKPKSETKPQQTSYGSTLWFDLYRHGLTQGFISTWLACREQARLKFLEGWTPQVVSTPLRFGSLFHDALAKLHVHDMPSKEALDQSRHNPVHAKTNPEEMEDLLGQALILLNGYFQTWTHEDEKFWVVREETFHHRYGGHLAHLPSTDWSDELTIPLRGRWDGLFEDKEGRLWLHETKTKGQIDEDGLQNTLHLNLQTMLYAYAAEKVHGQPVFAVLYDVVRRPQLKRKVNETLHDFHQRIKADVTDRPDHYFKRWTVELSESDTSVWEHYTLRPIVAEIEAWWRGFFTIQKPLPQLNPKHYMNPNSLFTAWGHCDLFPILTAGDTTGFVQREPDASGAYEPYPELLDL